MCHTPTPQALTRPESYFFLHYITLVLGSQETGTRIGTGKGYVKLPPLPCLIDTMFALLKEGHCQQAFQIVCESNEMFRGSMLSGSI